TDGHRRLSRPAPSPGTPGARPADEDQRPDPQGTEEDRGRDEEAVVGGQAGAEEVVSRINPGRPMRPDGGQAWRKSRKPRSATGKWASTASLTCRRASTTRS